MRIAATEKPYSDVCLTACKNAAGQRVVVALNNGMSQCRIVRAQPGGRQCRIVREGTHNSPGCEGVGTRGHGGGRQSR